jgi:hypothetical protein
VWIVTAAPHGAAAVTTGTFVFATGRNAVELHELLSRHDNAYRALAHVLRRAKTTEDADHVAQLAWTAFEMGFVSADELRQLTGGAS